MAWFDLDLIARAGTFVVLFLILAALEAVWPRRDRSFPRRVRWFSNLSLVTLNSLLVRLVLPVGAVGVALLARERQWGLLHNTQLPAWLHLPLALLFLDLAIYFQHVLFHAVPLFWRLHMVHHVDLDFDVSTGVRFHTVEILLSLGIKSATIVLLGPPVLAVLVFEILLNATSMFNHANLAMPRGLDRVLRLFMVTPDMHRVHHSAVPAETNSNFGFNLPWWDYLFGTYRSQPGAGHKDMTIGLAEFRGGNVEELLAMLMFPLAPPSGDREAGNGQ